MSRETNDEAQILFLSNHLRGPLGGAGARSWHQAKALSKLYALRVVIPGIDPVTGAKVTEQTYEGLDAGRVSVKRVWTLPNRRSSKLYRGMYFLSAMASQIWYGLLTPKLRCVVTMSLPVTMLAVAFGVARVRRVPLVVDVRDLPFETASEIGYLGSMNSTAVRLAKKVENFVLSCAHAVLTNSPRYVSHLVSYGVGSAKIIVAPIGYDDFDPPDVNTVESWRQRFIAAIDPEVKTIALYAGTMGFAFPVERFLDVASRLRDRKDIGFVFVGDGQRLEALQRRSEEESLQAYFPGRVTKSDVHAMCRAADVCLYPAENGTFSAAILGNKIFDYIGAERPVVYSGPDSAVSDLIVELDAGTVIEASDTEGLRRSIEMHASGIGGGDTGGLARLRETGYTAARSADKLVAVVEGLLARDAEDD